MAKKVNWSKVDPDIVYQGNMITLPDTPDKMPLRQAIKTLERKAEDEEQELFVFELIDAYPFDGAVALAEAMRRKYGWASPIPKPGFFGDTPPTMLTVRTGPNPEDQRQVPWGMFKLPGVENPVETHKHHHEGKPCLVITGTVKKREQHVVKDLANLTREILKTESIYMGKAIRLRTDEDGDLDMDAEPEFLPLDYIREEELILNKEEYDHLTAALWTPIRHSRECLKHKIPLKRGVLLEGPFGTGKTMTADITRKVCVDNEWTFILLDDVRGIRDALLFAQRYQPAVVFAEDVDRIITNRDQRGNDLLNTIDGIVSKNSQVITVLTTNFVEKLDRAMLRPGRLDAVVSVRPPDAQSVQRLLRLYGRDLINSDEDLTTVGEELAGNIPATIREVAERAKLSMIHNGRDVVTSEDLMVAARGMARHLDLLREKVAEPNVHERLGTALAELVKKAHANGRGDEMEHLFKRVEELHTRII